MSEGEIFSILIRHKEGREEMLRRCLESVYMQTYKNYNVTVSREYILNKEHFTKYLNYIPVPEQHYNLHCNDLKREVESGWLLYLDDDDAFTNENVLQDLSNIIVNNYPWKGAYIGQFLRKGIKKPSDYMIKNGIIKKGYCGGGCVILHHSFKDHADWKAKEAADFDWIVDLKAAGVPMKFIPVILQKTFQKGNGK